MDKIKAIYNYQNVDEIKLEVESILQKIDYWEEQIKKGRKIYPCMFLESFFPNTASLLQKQDGIIFKNVESEMENILCYLIFCKEQIKENIDCIELTFKENTYRFKELEKSISQYKNSENELNKKRQELKNMLVNKNKLKSKTKNKEIPEPLKYIEGIKKDPVDIQPKIYFLLYNNEVVYVGQTRQPWPTRIKQHLENKIFDEVYTLDVNLMEMDRIEAEYIQKYKPKYNLSNGVRVFN